MRKFWNHGEWSRNWGAWLGTLVMLLLLVSACTAKIEGTQNPGPGLTGGPAISNQLMCQAGLTACGTECVNLQSASTHCGQCGTACTAPAVCAGGSCNT